MKRNIISFLAAIIFAFQFAIAYANDTLVLKGSFISTANGYTVSANKIDRINEYRFYILDINLNKIVIEQDIRMRSLPDYCIATLDYIFMFYFADKRKRLMIYDFKQKSFTSKFSSSIQLKILPFNFINTPSEILIINGFPLSGCDSTENIDSAKVQIVSLNKKTLEVRTKNDTILKRSNVVLPLSLDKFLVFAKDTLFTFDKNVITHSVDSPLLDKVRIKSEISDYGLIALCEKEVILCKDSVLEDCKVLPFEANEGSEYYLSGAYLVEKRNNTFVSHKLIE